MPPLKRGLSFLLSELVSAKQVSSSSKGISEWVFKGITAEEIAIGLKCCSCLETQRVGQQVTGTPR